MTRFKLVRLELHVKQWKYNTYDPFELKKKLKREMLLSKYRGHWFWPSIHHFEIKIDNFVMVLCIYNCMEMY